MSPSSGLLFFALLVACSDDAAPSNGTDGAEAPETQAPTDPTPRDEAPEAAQSPVHAILAAPTRENVDVVCVAHANAFVLLGEDMPPELVPPGESEASLRASMIETIRETPEATLLEGQDELFERLRGLATCQSERGEAWSALPSALLQEVPEEAQRCHRRILAATPHTIRCESGSEWQLSIDEGIVVAAREAQASRADEAATEAAGNAFIEMMEGGD